MKILFLDIDGVLNTERQIRINALNEVRDILFDPAAMMNLKRILTETNCQIVITSTWRTQQKEEGYLWRELLRNFKESGVDLGGIVGVTKVLDEKMKPETRPLEIQDWLDQHQTVERFAILDDQWSMGHLNAYFIRCQDFSGITESIAQNVIKTLNE